jgi:hypothetical protein
MQPKIKRLFIVSIVVVITLLSVFAVRKYFHIFWGFETVTIHQNGMTQTLPVTEASAVIRILNTKEYTPGQGGCPFDENLTITVGDTVFALSQDGCHGLMEIKNQRYYSLNRSGWDALQSIFLKYGGDLEDMP